MDTYNDINEMWEFLVLFCNVVLINMHHVILKILTVLLPGSHQHFLKLSNRKGKLSKELILLQMMLALPLMPKIEESTEIPTEMSHSEVKVSYLKQLVLQTKHNPHSAADLPMVRCKQCY